MIRPPLAAALAAALAGCALTVSEPRALLPVTGFAALPADPRVEVEPGFEAYGARVAAELPAAIRDVEAAHYLPFLEPPKIHVCGTDTCFRHWVKTPKTSAAVVPDHRLFLSPRLAGQEADRLPGLLRHELAHLHLGQRFGHYHSSIPVWFHEGWATLTARGGGAEFTSDAGVREAIRAGRRLDFTLRDTPDSRHRATAMGLSVHEFYRQAMLVVGWLKTRDEARFRRFVLALQAGADFEIAFWDVYGQGPAQRLAGFYDDAMRDNSTDLAAPARP